MGREYVQCGDAGQRSNSHPGWDGANDVRFQHAALNDVKFKTYEEL